MLKGSRERVGIQAAWSSLWARRPPDFEYTALDLSGLENILDISAADLTCRVEAGISHDRLARHLDAVGLDWPVRPLPGQARLVQTYLSGAAFAASALLPNPRDWILGGTLVSGRGETVTTGGATVKNSAGYDLVRSCFGSMGVLAAPAQLQLRLRPRPQQRLELTAPQLAPEQYLALLSEARRQLDVVEAFQIVRGATRLNLAGPSDRVEEAAAALSGALPVLEAGGRAQAFPGEDWTGQRYRIVIPANKMAGFLAGEEPGGYWAFPFQRLAYSRAPTGQWFPDTRPTQLLPLTDPGPLRAGLALLCQGLDPDQRFV